MRWSLTWMAMRRGRFSITSAATGSPRTSSPRSKPAATAIGAAFRSFRQRLFASTKAARGGDGVARDRRLRSFAGARVALFGGARRADRGRHAAAEDQYERQRPAD